MNGSNLWTPIAITIFAWWFSTGLILLMVRLPRPSHSFILAGFGVLAGLGAWGIVDSSKLETNASVYCGFVCTLLVWGWHEASFLMGKITGPRPVACPQDVVGWRRFPYAAATLIYHEIALFVTMIAIGVVTWQAPNQIALITFSLLFAMRLSAKFNIFLGVPNLTEEFFPPHLEHLKSYLPKAPMNALMPFSLLACVLLIGYLWQVLAGVTPGSGSATALTITVTLAALGMLEHLFMITPLPDAALWRWAVPVRTSTSLDRLTPRINPPVEPREQDNA